MTTQVQFKRLERTSRLEEFNEADAVEIIGVRASNQNERGRIVRIIEGKLLNMAYKKIFIASRGSQDTIKVQDYFRFADDSRIYFWVHPLTIRRNDNLFLRYNFLLEEIEM